LALKDNLHKETDDEEKQRYVLTVQEGTSKVSRNTDSTMARKKYIYIKRIT
jgi:hypothetical protein